MPVPSFLREITLDEAAFDYNIGSYFMNLKMMSSRYRNLKKVVKEYDFEIPENLPKEILRALKYFYYTTGKLIFDKEKIKDFCERHLLGKQRNRLLSHQQKNEYSHEEWKNALKVLSDAKDQLNFIELDGDYIRTEEVYLERIIERDIKWHRIINILNNAYQDENIKDHGFFTSAYGFIKLVNLAQTTDEIYKIFTLIYDLGIKLDTVTFNILLNKLKAFEEAGDTLDKLKRKRIQQNLINFTSRIHKAEKFKDAKEFLDQMLEKGLKPDRVTFGALSHKTGTFN